MIVFGFFDDCSYMSASLERFTSISDAKAQLRARYESNGHLHCPVRYVHRTADGAEYLTAEDGEYLFPAVTEHATITLYATTETDYPMCRLSIGPRGGIVKEDN